jgi:hypothetical protein
LSRCYIAWPYLSDMWYAHLQRGGVSLLTPLRRCAYHNMSHLHVSFVYVARTRVQDLSLGRHCVIKTLHFFV